MMEMEKKKHTQNSAFHNELIYLFSPQVPQKFTNVAHLSQSPQQHRFTGGDFFFEENTTTAAAAVNNPILGMAKIPQCGSWIPAIACHASSSPVHPSGPATAVACCGPRVTMGNSRCRQRKPGVSLATLLALYF